jgi:hypothetical protein
MPSRNSYGWLPKRFGDRQGPEILDLGSHLSSA